MIFVVLAPDRSLNINFKLLSDVRTNLASIGLFLSVLERGLGMLSLKALAQTGRAHLGSDRANSTDRNKEVIRELSSLLRIARESGVRRMRSHRTADNFNEMVARFCKGERPIFMEGDDFAEFCSAMAVNDRLRRKFERAVLSR